ncbi:MAG: nitrate reductase NapAB chaperone NapD [Desulforhopalus sp.]|jgi:nitrate reductase NapAB chaperone NapD
MPISGIIITSTPENLDDVLSQLKEIPGVEVHGADEKANIVAVLDTKSSEEMETIIDRINKDEKVLNVGVTYLNTEDEADRMALGEKLPKPFGFRKPS